MDATAGLGGGNALDAVNSGFVLEPAVGLVAIDLEDDFFVAADVGWRFADQLDLPARSGLDVASVHPKQLAGEQGSLIAAGAGADFDDGVFLVGRVFGNESQAQMVVDGA